MAQATFHLERNVWTAHQQSFAEAFETNECGGPGPWQVGVPKEISDTGCLAFAYPVDSCPGGELDLVRLVGDQLTFGERSVDLCDERSPGISEAVMQRVPEEVEIDGPRFYPEGVAIGPDRALYAGSFTTGEIRRAAFGSATAETLVEAWRGDE